ncbi:MAG: hypothetical protein IKG14_04515 [Clostridia bacterium]|nr:hypothetical protein [Clostridia bacterium]
MSTTDFNQVDLSNRTPTANADMTNTKNISIALYRIVPLIPVLVLLNDLAIKQSIIQNIVHITEEFAYIIGANDVDIYNSLALLTIDIKSIKL